MQEELQQIIDCLDTSIPKTIRILFDKGLGSWICTCPNSSSHLHLIFFSIFIFFVAVFYYKVIIDYTVNSSQELSTSLLIRLLLKGIKG